MRIGHSIDLCRAEAESEVFPEDLTDVLKTLKEMGLIAKYRIFETVLRVWEAPGMRLETFFHIGNAKELDVIPHKRGKHAKQ